ncbi:hypothetical protein ENBRE01_2329 [Enteropsectra breve]|nr:hypothetical protein ENBRE01_2329 [Enteropsectra breve]
MDNVPFHKCRNIRDLITVSGHRFVLLPPYSPFLNPIENMFAQWKDYVKRLRSNSNEELLSNIQVGFLQISGTNCANYYRRMLSFLNKALNNEIILEES